MSIENGMSRRNFLSGAAVAGAAIAGMAGLSACSPSASSSQSDAQAASLSQLSAQAEKLLEEVAALRDYPEKYEALRVEAEALRPDAEAYVEFRNRIGNIECEAQQRAAKLEADTQAQLRQMAESFRAQYEALTGTFDAASAHVTAELRKVEVNLSQLPRTLDSVSRELEKLEKLRHEFEYWYPYDLRVSGKDLIKNHLMMSLYIHQAIWPDMSKMPRAYFCNGHIQLNNEKMSKSTGNFLTVDDAIKQFGADATRFACADAGDSLDDANFAVGTANAAILSLTTEEEFIRTVMSGELPTVEKPEAEYHFFVGFREARERRTATSSTR